MSDDYGHYGKGITGYVHYTEAMKGGGSGKRPSNAGCLTLILGVIGVVVFVLAIIL